jgi:hypothetical protein
MYNALPGDVGGRGMFLFQNTGGTSEYTWAMKTSKPFLSFHRSTVPIDKAFRTDRKSMLPW